MSAGLKNIKGGCHCGYITYTFDAHPDAETGKYIAHRCNCTFCQKTRTTNLAIAQPTDFRLVTPASRDEIPVYAPRVPSVKRYFCEKCGVHVWIEGFYEYEGQKIPLFNVNLATVDQPQDGFDLSQDVKCMYWDGLANNFHLGLRDTPWPGGLS